jgi:predicted HTH transcriptional regulator
MAEIVALANTGGGVLVFGVNDQLRVEALTIPKVFKGTRAHLS